VASTLGFSGGVETTVLPPQAIPLSTTIIIKDGEAMPKQRSEGWVQTSLALARGMPLRQGSTL